MSKKRLTLFGYIWSANSAAERIIPAALNWYKPRRNEDDEEEEQAQSFSS
jgi:hypothetical protein